MKTLYDLLEALPDDDADGLRAAFRKAAKANHPDFNPGNPEASERFRRIIRANAILSDQQQRAEYDRLLELAKKQQASPPPPKRRSLLGTFRRLAADATTSAIVSVVLIGGYFAYRSAERLPLASAQAVEIARIEPTQTVAVAPAEAADASNQTEERTRPQSVEANNSEQDVNQQVASKSAKPEAPALVTDGAASANAFTSPPGDNGTKDIAFYRERGMRAYRSGELYLALANFGVAIDLDPGSPESYIDRGIVFHRLGDLKRALSDIAEAKRLDDLNRKQYAPQVGAP
ncbi:J domain-containing protein [Bradyrhizobium roseum]|uniref:J domain-containing protein n=1 Tax=Bradyrhizobium roseum TaxID=3056648 RepID=UPI002620A214|nr:DnaJ domain-containing protein [Bradyrhizobium roseus]WKA27990.1 DnaJ domain-containing protein [Bradyrhizobium roseus]